MIRGMMALALALALWAGGSVAMAQPAHGALLVVSKQTQSLAIVDAASLRVVGRVPVGENPHEVVVGPDGRTAYVSNFGEGVLHSLAVVDLPSRRALPSIDVRPLQGPHGLAPLGRRLWFTADRSKALAALDLDSGRIVEVVGAGQDRTHMIWVSPDGKKMVASNPGSGTLSVFDRVLISPVTAPGAPPPPAAYTSPGWRHTLVPTGAGAEGFAVTPDGREAWTGDNQGRIFVVDLASNAVTATLEAGTAGANRLAFTPDGARLLVTLRSSRDLVVIDRRSRSVVRRIPIQQRGASGIQIQPDGRRAFIACPRDHYVAVVDLDRLEMTGAIDAGREPDGLAWWPQ